MKKQNKPFTSVLLLAGGQGNRFGFSDGKQWFSVLGKSVLCRALEVYAELDEVDEVILALRPQDMERAKAECAHINKPIYYVEGGACRAQSAKNAFLKINRAAEFVVVADAARCLTHPEDVRRVIHGAYEHGAACATVRITDTVKRCSLDGVLEQTVDRSSLRASTTPQAMRVSDYAEALRLCEDLSVITDDCMLLEKQGVFARSIECLYPNPKLTSADDVELFEAILKKRG